MTLREWCEAEGHPYCTRLYVMYTDGFEPVGKACVCGQRHEPMPNADRAWRVLMPAAVDETTGTDRTGV